MGECLIIRGGGGTDTSNATATASVVLSGYTCYVNDQLIAGSMPVQTLNQKLGAGGSVTIPAGYYDGSSSVISTSTLAEETAANATAAQILSWYTAWVNGGLVQGSMVNWGNTGATLAVNGVYWIPAGWHAGAGVVNQSLAVHWGGTYTPNTGNQVMCWAGWYTGGNIVVLGSSNLIASNIVYGVNIFGVTGTYRPTIQYGWYPNSRLQVNYRQWNSNHPQMLDYNKSGDTYITLSTTYNDIIDWGGASTNWLPWSDGWDLVNAGFNWVCFRLWTNQQALWDSVSIYLQFYPGWWNTSSGSFGQGYNSQIVSIYCPSATEPGNDRYLGAVWTPMQYIQNGITYLYSTMRVRAKVNESRADFSICGSALYWTQGQIID